MNLKAEMARIAAGAERMMLNDRGLDLAPGIARADLAMAASPGAAMTMAPMGPA